MPAPFEAIELLRVKEARLRTGQADDALVELRRLLRITMGMWDFKFTDVGFSQRGNTRARLANGLWSDGADIVFFQIRYFAIPREGQTNSRTLSRCARGTRDPYPLRGGFATFEATWSG